MNKPFVAASVLALVLPIAAFAQKKAYPDSFAVLNELNKASTVMVVEQGIVPRPLGVKIAQGLEKVIADGEKPGAKRPGDYLAWERTQPTKHEFHLGEVFAMAGGSPRHNCLSGAMIAELRAALRGKGYHVLTSDQRIAAEQDRRYVYADAVVVCGPMKTEPGTSDVLANPRILVEVLSRSTETYDCGEKWEAYQRLASLSDYLLVAQTSVRVEHYQR